MRYNGCKRSLLYCALAVQLCVADSKLMSIRDYAERDQRPIESITYKQVDAQPLRLLITKPNEWARGQARTAIVWIHGGGWVAGEPKKYIPHMRYSAARGAVSFSIQYRLMQPWNYKEDKTLSQTANEAAGAKQYQAFLDGPSLRDCIADCEDAIRYIRRNAEVLGIDPQKVIVIGDSAGGHLATCLGTLASDEALANAVVNCNAITDLTVPKWSAYIKPGNEHESQTRALSPQYQIRRDGPPTLILHGQRDSTVDISMAEAFHQALLAAEVDVSFKRYAQAQHAFISYAYSATLEEITQSLIDIDAWLVQHGFLQAETAIQMPNYPITEALISSIDTTFTGPKILHAQQDFPATLRIEMEVKPGARFNGTLFELPGTFGCSYTVRNHYHDFKALRLRQRGKQIELKPEQWNQVTITMNRDKVMIEIDEQRTEIPNHFRHGFVSDQIIIGDSLNAEIRAFRIYSIAAK